MRSRTTWLAIESALVVCFLSFSGEALAATAKTAKAAAASPSIWGQAVNLFSDFINLVAHYVGGDYGIALIIVTVIIRLLTMPLMLTSLRNSKKMQLLRPQMQELKEKYGKEPKKYQEETMALYRTEGINPLAGCMPMIVQMVVLTLLYRAIYTDHAMLYSNFLGVLPLGTPDHTFILPVLAGVTSYFQQKLTMVQMDPSQQRLLQYLFPIMIFFFALHAFAALSLYWVFSNVFTIAQMYFIKVKSAN
ncbi:MAG: YidC/Oxa1 family membrane protein insertase [Bacilli bacterium]